MTEQSSSTLIVLHDIRNPSSWPPELSHITSRFSRPLASIPNVAPEYLSPNALDVYKELGNLPQVSVDQDIDAEFPIQVADVLDTVLTSVKMLRDLSASVGHFGTPQPTLPVWRSFLGSLSLACCKDALIMTDVPFLLPWTIPLASEPETTIFEGRASFLISLYMAPKEAIGDAMDVNSSMPSAKYNSVNTTSETSFTLLDGPPDGHILPGPGRRVDCVLPIICVADEHNIQALVTSTVYQKYCWGISLPTIGVSIERLDTIATVVIGWIDEKEGAECHLRQQLPLVHLAFPSSILHKDTSLGVFDLLDPISALQFTRLILGLHHQFSTIAMNLATPCIHDLCWRLDHTVLTDPVRDFHASSESESDRGRILQWAQEVVPWDYSEDNTLGFPPFDGPSGDSDSMIRTKASSVRLSAMDTQESLRSSAQEHSADSRSLSESLSQKSSMSTSDSENDPALLIDEAEKCSSTDTDDRKRSTYSASALALMNGSLSDNKAGTEHWLWERTTIRLGRIKTSGTSAAETHMNQMIDKYNEVFEFAWPRKWKNTNTGTRRHMYCDSIHRDMFDLLFFQYGEHSKLASQTSMTVSELDEETSSFLESRISMLLNALVIASGRVRQGHQHITGNEPERRLAVDLLLLSFCCSTGVAVSDSFLLEPVVRLSRNKAVEGCLHDFQQTRVWLHLVVRQAMSISSDKDKFPRSWAVASQTLEQAARKNNTLSQSSYRNQLSAESRSHEPMDAAADSVVCTRYPLVSQKPTSDGTMWSTILRKYVPSFKTKYGGRVNIPPRSEVVTDHSDCTLCPFVAEPPSTSTKPTSSPLSSPNPANEIILPFVYAEYKRNYDYKKPRKVFHQCHLYCISTVDFLASFGIVDFPVFGIVTAGDEVSVMMAWRSSVLPERKEKDVPPHEGFNIIMDENLITFDLTKPLDIYHLAISLHRIHRHQQKLKGLLDARGRKDLIKKVESPAFNHWAMPLRPPQLIRQKAK